MGSDTGEAKPGVPYSALVTATSCGVPGSACGGQRCCDGASAAPASHVACSALKGFGQHVTGPSASGGACDAPPRPATGGRRLDMGALAALCCRGWRYVEL